MPFAGFARKRSAFVLGGSAAAIVIMAPVASATTLPPPVPTLPGVQTPLVSGLGSSSTLQIPVVPIGVTPTSGTTTSGCTAETNLYTEGYYEEVGFVDEGVLVSTQSTYDTAVNCDPAVSEMYVQSYLDINQQAVDAGPEYQCFGGNCPSGSSPGDYTCDEAQGFDCTGDYQAVGSFKVYSNTETFENPDPSECQLSLGDHQIECVMYTEPPINVASTDPPGVTYA